ncbi:MAG TPA: adenylate kinase [Candidatus Dormibacteraeota bacterium]|jgi:adenylate kinase family enzyme|nr:adenylate kinase [Candidatus Dormibacteraeota bacterium]
MDRVAVVGNSGAGKTSLARGLAHLLGAPYTELDAIFHQPGWTELDDREFRRRVGVLVAEPRWVIDGNYQQVRDLIWARADTMVWLDLPRTLVLRRVVWRTVRRVIAGQPLWNDNRERLREALSWQPERSIIRWSWTQHSVYRERYAAAMHDPAFTHLAFHRLRSSTEVKAFLASSG